MRKGSSTGRVFMEGLWWAGRTWAFILARGASAKALHGLCLLDEHRAALAALASRGLAYGVGSWAFCIKSLLN